MKNQKAQHPDEQHCALIKAGYLLVNEVVPRLKSAIPKAVKFIGSEDADELAQDSIAIAARMLQ